MNDQNRERLPARLKATLSVRQPRSVPEWRARPAAVLLPLYLDGDAWHLLYTRRTDDVETHRGQVAFPGGQIEDDDEGPEDAALREAHEELALRPQDVSILGALDTLLTVSQFRITPVVGLIPWPYPLQPNPSEVAHVFGVSLAWLADPANLEVRYREPIIPGPKIPVYYFKPLGQDQIWGATARITLNLLEILKNLP